MIVHLFRFNINVAGQGSCSSLYTDWIEPKDRLMYLIMLMAPWGPTFATGTIVSCSIALASRAPSTNKQLRWRCAV